MQYTGIISVDLQTKVIRHVNRDTDRMRIRRQTDNQDKKTAEPHGRPGQTEPTFLIPADPLKTRSIKRGEMASETERPTARTERQTDSRDRQDYLNGTDGQQR